MTTPSLPIVGVVSDRRRLARTTGRPDDDGVQLIVRQAAAAAAAGADFYQIREPDLDGGPLLTVVREILSSVAGRMQVFVNDRADVAAVTGAGVHLPARSMAAARLRAWMPPSVAIARAVHSPSAARDAGAVDVVVAGTAARTTSKTPGHPVLGPEGLRAIVEASAAPVVAIGGLGPSDWVWVAGTGAAGMAGIGAFLPGDGDTIETAVWRAVGAWRAAIETLEARSFRCVH